MLEYFIDKIYIYDDRIIIKFSEASGTEQEYIVEREDGDVFRMYGDEFDHLMFCSTIVLYPTPSSLVMGFSFILYTALLLSNLFLFHYSEYKALLNHQIEALPQRMH